MIDVGEQIVALQVIYKSLKRDFKEQKGDLYLLKSNALTLLSEASSLKTSEKIAFTSFDQKELKTLCIDIKKLIKAIEKEISIQEKEEYYTSNNTEI